MFMKSASIRNTIFDMVSRIDPFDALEKEHKDFVLEWIASGVELFRIEKPAVPEIHLVSYFIGVSEDLSKVLLVDHKKAELWLPAGGHVEPGEHPKETVSREAEEELGIKAKFLFEDPIFLTVTKTVGNVTKHTDVSLWYVLKEDPKVQLNYDAEEFNQIRWFERDQIPFEKSDPHLKRFLDKLSRY